LARHFKIQYLVHLLLDVVTQLSIGKVAILVTGIPEQELPPTVVLVVVVAEEYLLFMELLRLVVGVVDITEPLL
jgi:hypothetical protein